MPETTTIEGTYALNLSGWDRCSIWGLDRMETTYGLFAQLWRNTDDRDGDPRHLISGVQDLVTLARKIAGVEQAQTRTTSQASPVGRPRAQTAAARAAVAPAGQHPLDDRTGQPSR